MTQSFRVEHDMIGDRQVPADAYYGVHTLRALENFPITGTPISIYPELIKALSAVRGYRDELMTLGATAPGATLAQRLYAARRRANLSTSEIAQAAGVDEEMIVRAETEETLPTNVTAAIENLIEQIS